GFEAPLRNRFGCRVVEHIARPGIQDAHVDYVSAAIDSETDVDPPGDVPSLRGTRVTWRNVVGSLQAADRDVPYRNRGGFRVAARLPVGCVAADAGRLAGGRLAARERRGSW